MENHSYFLHRHSRLKVPLLPLLSKASDPTYHGLWLPHPVFFLTYFLFFSITHSLRMEIVLCLSKQQPFLMEIHPILKITWPFLIEMPWCFGIRQTFLSEIQVLFSNKLRSFHFYNGWRWTEASTVAPFIVRKECKRSPVASNFTRGCAPPFNFPFTPPWHSFPTLFRPTHTAFNPWF